MDVHLGSKEMRYCWIDGCKGLAILMVIAVHVAQFTTNAPAWFSSVSNFGAMGVQLFFVISAYCACLGTDASTPQRYGDTLIRRYRRLAPPYIAGMIMYAILYTCGIGNADWSERSILDVVLNVLLLNTFSDTAQNTMVPGGWSISCIALYAFVFPLFSRLLRENYVVKVSLLCGISVLISATMYYMFDLSKQFCYMFFATHLPCFLVGMIYYKKKKQLRYISGWIVFGISSVVLCIAAGLVSFVHSAFLYLALLVSVGFVGWCCLLSRHERYVPNALVIIGCRSYSIFIFHFSVIYLVFPVLGSNRPWFIRFGVTYIMVVLLSWMIASMFSFLVKKVVDCIRI